MLGFASVSLGTGRKGVSNSISKVQRSRVFMAKQIEVVRGADEATINKFGCRSWPVWSSETGTFPWEYSENERCLLIDGNVTVTPEGGEPVSFGAGDMVTFPAGMKCMWDVKKAVNKHYLFF
ncbi:hypothetical protein NDN08_000984 [Rhodosorus marinus]|uniref:(S)-ureidoglycine aminohydrolase cupin domain-containing protein n=1 Tax=Rhodosorus marinus TaxID=101924 RepID=A0AAV8UTL0_9RHOD|nr:hypothetical protein NDN08_000984 [Rhodosorus marinus]